MHSLDVTCLEARVLQPDKLDVSASGHESRSDDEPHLGPAVGGPMGQAKISLGFLIRQDA